MVQIPGSDAALVFLEPHGGVSAVETEQLGMKPKMGGLQQLKLIISGFAFDLRLKWLTILDLTWFSNFRKESSGFSGLKMSQTARMTQTLVPWLWMWAMIQQICALDGLKMKRMVAYIPRVCCDVLFFKFIVRVFYSSSFLISFLWDKTCQEFSLQESRIFSFRDNLLKFFGDMLTSPISSYAKRHRAAPRTRCGNGFYMSYLGTSLAGQPSFEAGRFLWKTGTPVLPRRPRCCRILPWPIGATSWSSAPPVLRKPRRRLHTCRLEFQGSVIEVTPVVMVKPEELKTWDATWYLFVWTFFESFWYVAYSETNKQPSKQTANKKATTGLFCIICIDLKKQHETT